MRVSTVATSTNLRNGDRRSLRSSETPIHPDPVRGSAGEVVSFGGGGSSALARYGEWIRRVLPVLLLAAVGLPASAQTQIRPDCVIDFSFTAAGQTQGGVGTCGNNLSGVLQWTLTYKSTGFSALSLRVESAPDNGGVPGTWGAFSGTLVNGVNPNTSTTQASTQLSGFVPWIRVALSSKTGTGVITGELYGCRQPGCSGGLALSVPPSGPAGGDLSGNYPNPTVAKVNGTAYGASPAAHQVPIVGVYKTLPNCPADALSFTQGTDAFGCNTIPTSLPPSGAAGGDLSGNYPNPTVAKVNGTAYGASPAAHQVPIVGVYKTLPNCPADALSFTQGTDAFGCNTIPASLPPSGTAGGDLSGTYPNPGVAKVNGNTPGGTCTNQFTRSVDTSARPGCADIVNADLAGANTTGLAEGVNLYYTNARVVSELGTLNATSQQSRCTGTGYTLTATFAQVVCGTTQPTVTLSTAGTYLLLFTARVDHAGATYAANRTISVGLERSNNTPVQITGGTASLVTNIITTTTETAEGGNLSGFALYTTANTTDTITLFALVSVLPTAGSSTVSAGNVLALRIF